MDSLMTLGDQHLSLLLLLAIVLYLGALIALTVFRFGLNGISAKNITEMMNSRTMHIFFVIFLTILLCRTVVSFQESDKLKKMQEDQKKHFEEFREQIEELKQQQREMEQQKKRKADIVN